MLGDSIVLIAPNSAEFVAVSIAVLQIGAYLVTPSRRLAPEEMTFILSTSRARAIVAHESCCESLAEILAALPGDTIIRLSLGQAKGFACLQSLMESEPARELDEPVAGRAMTFTSATTGRPKGIKRLLSDAAVAQNRLLDFASGMYASAGISNPEQSTYLCQSMLYHSAPLDAVLAAVHLGQRVVLMDNWRPDWALDLIQKYKVAATFMVPYMFVRLCKLPLEMRKSARIESLRIVTHGAAPCPKEIKQQMIEWWGPVFLEIYGSSEGGGTKITTEEWLQKPGSVGKAHSGADIKILNETGDELPVNVEGLVYIRPYTGDRFEYIDDSLKTCAAYKGDYFTAGDIGYLDAEKYLYLCDRRSDLIIVGGVNVYPAEVERVLILHDDVADCAVVGVPHEVLGQMVIAVVQLQMGREATQKLKGEIFMHAARLLTTGKLPGRIEFVTDLPRDPAGKLFRRKVVETLKTSRLQCA